MKECAHACVDRWLRWGELAGDMKRQRKRPGKGLGAFLGSAMPLDSCLALHGLGEAVAHSYPVKDA